MSDEMNGDVPFTGDARVDAAILRIRGKFRDLEDAMIVQAHLEKRMGERIKEQATYVDRHDQWMKHMEDKLAALTDILMKRGGGPESTERERHV